MRVLLVYPPISMQERYSSAIGNAGGQQMPLGVFYLAAVLREKGHEVAVIDGEAENVTAADIVARVAQFQPGLVGISSTTVAFHRALEVAAEIRAGQPALPIVLGGPHVSSNAAHAMSFPVFDYAIVGEGEVSLVELVESLERGADLTAIGGLVYRKDGKLVVNPCAAWVQDLDAIPFPAYDLVADLSRYTPPPCNYKKRPVANIITSRGCPNQCTFCDRSVFGRSLRQRSAANVAAEIEHLWNRYHVREIAFVDDTFTIRPQRIRDLFEILDRKGISFPWTCMSRINTVDLDLLRFMRDHGCWHVSFGIESGSEDILRRIKKNISLEQTRRVIEWCAALRIRTKGFFIVGHPGETPQTAEQSIRLALELPLDDVVATLNTPIPGSPQHREAAQYGSLDETDWSQFNYWRPVFVPHGWTQEELLAKHREFYRRFYLRPRIIGRYVRSFFSPSGPRRVWVLARSLPFIFRKGKAHSGKKDPPGAMRRFVCNVCGAENQLPASRLVREDGHCKRCGCYTRLRAMIHALSTQLLGEPVLAHAPRHKEIRGVGCSDWGYVRYLAGKFDYVNTYYNHRPRLDLRAVDWQRYPPGSLHFIICGDVLEHVAPPLEKALENLFKLLRPGGLAIITVPSSLAPATREHFADLQDWRVEKKGPDRVLVNRRSDGTVERFENLCFHGGKGETLEFRLFSRQGLLDSIRKAGFEVAAIHDQPAPEYGITLDAHDFVLVARKPVAAVQLLSQQDPDSLGRQLDCRPVAAVQLPPQQPVVQLPPQQPVHYTGADNLEAMTSARNYNAFLLDEVLRNSGGAAAAVDFGAGTGTFARALRERGLRVTCVEPDVQLRRRLADDEFECHAGMEELPVAAADYIFSLNVLEHIEDDASSLRALFRRLRPGGRLYLYLPAFPILYSTMDRKVGHYRRYRRRRLTAQLEAAGFRVDRARYADSLGFFATLFYRCVGSRRGDLNAAGLRFYDRFMFPVSRLLDRVLGRFLGKNVAVVAVRPAPAAAGLLRRGPPPPHFATPRSPEPVDAAEVL
jgi:anaerobic magnesium-protoporphyrin IX monomethyl ester cyclase